ncbi:hypothetical protein [Cupriavidus necator]|uniref:hypothetical protein n=1 Tax=Cupriavidus necator TaxID=106590 RepID=UPI0013DF0042|nr:hypothetical protein [Cupriavidus necator]
MKLYAELTALSQADLKQMTLGFGQLPGCGQGLNMQRNKHIALALPTRIWR